MQNDPLFTKLQGDKLAAAGTIVFCTDPISKKNFILFGISGANQLCYFHGWNDQKNLPYIQASQETAAREYAEESLEVLSSYQNMLQALQNEQYHVQILPRLSLNCRAFAVFAGFLGATARQSIVQRFSNLLQNPLLSKCQRENKGVVWVPANSLYVGALACQSNKEHIKVTTEHGIEMYLRSWQTGWFKDVFSSTEADQLFFTAICKDNAASSIACFLTL